MKFTVDAVKQFGTENTIEVIVDFALNIASNKICAIQPHGGQRFC